MSDFRCLVVVILAGICSLKCTTGPGKDERLARTYCGSCHLYPDPQLLDKTTWEKHVLPQMRFRMGLDLTPLWKLPPDEIDIITGVIPRAMISEEDMKRIEQFYLLNAPTRLNSIADVDDDSLSTFVVRSSGAPIAPMITLLKFDSVKQRFIVGSRTSEIYIFDTDFTQKYRRTLSSPPSDVFPVTPDSLHILQMGKMDPNDLFNGRLVALNLPSGKTTTLIDSLNRPVHFSYNDFDNDGDVDILVSCFGNFTGSLILFENTRNSFRRHVLHNLPGNRKTVVRDVNNDGLLDIITLTTQGDEQLMLFLNGNGMQFSQRSLYRFPPVFGSSFFELRDMDNDGDEDIVYTNGDNSDYSTILKPYHGVRILTNDGEYNFSESAFLPMHGAYQTIADDFDRDGDIDIAAISFFNDFAGTPKRGFIYYENTGASFKPHTSTLANAGRWITMESMDINNDGFPDLVLGALNFNIDVDAETMRHWKESNSPFLILTNTGKRDRSTSVQNTP